MLRYYYSLADWNKSGYIKLSYFELEVWCSVKVIIIYQISIKYYFSTMNDSKFPNQSHQARRD